MERMLTTGEVARLLGVSVSRIRHLVSARAIPYYKPLGRVLFSQSEIREWIQSSRVPTIQEKASTITLLNRKKNGY